MNNYLKTENFEKKGKKHQNNKIYKKKQRNIQGRQHCKQTIPFILQSSVLSWLRHWLSVNSQYDYEDKSPVNL